MMNLYDIYAKYMWKCKYGDEYLFANELFMGHESWLITPFPTSSIQNQSEQIIYHLNSLHFRRNWSYTKVVFLLNQKEKMETMDEMKESQAVSTHQLLRIGYGLEF